MKKQITSLILLAASAVLLLTFFELFAIVGANPAHQLTSQHLVWRT